MKKSLQRKKSVVNRNFLAMGILVIFLLSFVIATTPIWQGSTVNYTTDEEDLYFHNLSLNISGYGGDITFDFDTEGSYYWSNETGRNLVSLSDIASWINIYEASWGNLTINSSWDNQSGFFEIPIQATNTTTDDAATTVFEFMINATNDFPQFNSSESRYNWSQGAYSEYTIGVFDEELHYPISFTLTPVNCTHASWVEDRYPNQNCTIFDLTEYTSDAVINLTPTRDDVGEYWFNLSIEDFNSGCPHSYCDSSSYEVNLTNSKLVFFEVLSTVEINVTDCEDQVVMEDTFFTCEINITTTGSSDLINTSSNAYYQNSAAWTIFNESFFHTESSGNSVNFTRSINISFTPEKRNVGNYTINFSAFPNSTGNVVLSEFNFYVNYTEEPVSLGNITNLTIYENRTVYVSGTDDDLLIQDLSVRDENLTFATNVSFLTLTPQALGSFENYINLTIDIDYDYLNGIGENNYSALINVTDENGSVSSQILIVEVLSNSPATWNESKSYVNVSNQGEEVYINVSEYVNDTDSLTFSYTLDSEFSSFDLTSSGIINFTSNNSDVGYHNVTINAYDGKLNSYRSFNFTVYNVDDSPGIVSLSGSGVSPSGSIDEGESVEANEDSQVNFTMFLNDSDFYIPTAQRSQFYDENLTVTVNATNSSSMEVDLFNFSLVSLWPNAQVRYLAQFTPTAEQVDNYTIVVNVTDRSGLFVTRTFGLNISGVNDAPILESISNEVLTINDTLYIDVNASDQEDGNDSLEVINFNITNLTVGGDFLSINITTGEINFSLNESYQGVWTYNVSVNDSLGAIDYQTFVLTVYGYPSVDSPSSGYIFNWTERVSTGDLFYNVSYPVNDTLLTYVFYMDKVEFLNSTEFNYTDLINDSFIRNETNFTLDTNNNLTWNFTPNYTEESYWMYKNLTLLVYNPDYPELNRSRNWKVNISHVNQNVTVIKEITDKGPVSRASTVDIDLSEHFEDADYFDLYWDQTVNFSINTVSGSGFIAAASSFSGWTLSLGSDREITERISITAYEYDVDPDNSSISTFLGSDTTESFQVEFIDPVTTPVSSGGGGSTTRLKFFSIKLIIPGEVLISDQNFIEVPFSIQNDGQTDLRGIDLSSTIQFNNEFSEDVSITISDSYIDELKIGESEDYTMRVDANTQRNGRYKATLFANVTSPKFSDFGEFFIELRRTNESEAEQILIFTEKFISDNAECIELTELLNQARDLYDDGDYPDAIRTANEVTEACEEAINKNEQISFSASTVVANNFYYLVTFLITMFLGVFIYYIYRRVRFNKYRRDRYI